MSGPFEQYSNSIEPNEAAVGNINEKLCKVVAPATEVPMETLLLSKSAAAAWP
jgi:hypothetical protein